jgi:DUF1365 family protein
MMTVSAIYPGYVVHTRFQPVRHRLRHRMLWLLLDIDELPALSRSLRWFSLNRFNLASFHDSDHGAGNGESMRHQVERMLRQAGVPADGGAIHVLCMPRLLGMVFNPLSVFLCHRADGGLCATIYEVNNTFGERHSYLIPVADDEANRQVMRQSCTKQFFVSPFMDMRITYRFRVMRPDRRVSVAIEGHDGDAPIIAAAFAGTRRELTDGDLLRAVFGQPLLALHVLGAIHWEALKLWCKGVRLRRKPPPPAEPLSVVQDAQPAAGQQ